MRNTILKLALMASAVSAVSSAALVTCNNTVTADVTSLGAQVCAGSGLTFSTFEVIAPAGVTVGLSTIQYDATKGDVILNFSPFAGSVRPIDIKLFYKVTGTSDAIDFNVLGSPLSGIIFTEQACSTQQCAGGGNVVYANINNGNGTIQQGFAPLVPGPQTTIWIKKDIQYLTGSSMTDFTNSHHVPVPEPMTLSMMGAGLLALGLVRRKK